MLIPSFPGIASLTSRGLVSTDSQPFRGQKSFMGPLTAGASDKALVGGTDVADGSVNGGFRMLSLVTGFGGTEKEYVRVSRPTAFDQPVMTIDSQNITNTRGLEIKNTPVGVGGLKIGNAGGGYLALNAQQGGSPHQLYAENKGLELYQNSNAYDTTKLMRFAVGTTGGVAASVPAFDFHSEGALQTNQKLARFKDNSGDIFSVVRSVVAQIEIGSSVGGISHNGTGFTFNSRAKNNEYWEGTLYYHTGSGVSLEAATCARLSSDAVDGASAVAAASESASAWSNATAKLHSFRSGPGAANEKSAIMSNGEFEHAVSGAGIVLKSPNGTRWRLTINNAGAVVVAAA